MFQFLLLLLIIMSFFYCDKPMNTALLDKQSIVLANQPDNHKLLVDNAL